MRRLIQLAATVLTNPHAANFLGGRIYRGGLKNFCAPGLNCWSCPAATLSCPLGAIQTMSFYAAGCTLLIGLLLGRMVCGFLCPFGFLQELLNKIPAPKFSLPRRLTRVKYFLLAMFVLIGPVLTELNAPTFCQYICPAGTLEAGLPLIAAHEDLRNRLGSLFALKVTILAAVIVGSVLVHRFFCRVMCPLGAVYGLLNRWSFWRLNFAADRCVGCGRCRQACPIELDPTREVNSAECVRCERCVEACPTGALTCHTPPVKFPLKRPPTVDGS
ncbi:MAG: 4Fe-4S binding protein [Quinella sp. 2Q5]|nr:4Fe-4S binding protein [Quinella sp. 2Q5]